MSSKPKNPTSDILSDNLPQSIETLKLRKLTIAEVPYTLPIGVFSPDGDRLQNYTLKPYDGACERALSRLCAKKQNRTAEILVDFLPVILDTIGGKKLSDLATLHEISVRDMLQNLYLADAIHILLQLRIDEYDKSIRLSAKCPNCGTPHLDAEDEPSDLSTVEVNLVRQLSSPLIEVLLKSPVTFYAGTDEQETISAINIRPVRIRDLERLNKVQKGEDVLSLQHRILFSTLVGSDKNTGDEYQNSKRTLSILSVESLYDKLATKDRTALMKAVTKIGQIGPEVQTEVHCQNPVCGNKFSASIPWQDLGSFLSGIM
jgi:hypothetical protein